jgi:hypothetical protein
MFRDWLIELHCNYDWLIELHCLNYLQSSQIVKDGAETGNATFHCDVAIIIRLHCKLQQKSVPRVTCMCQCLVECKSYVNESEVKRATMHLPLLI